MKVGITGGNGFIGGWVSRELADRGHEVVLFDRRGGPSPCDELFLGDITDEIAVTEFAAHVEGIIHLAAVLGTQETIGNPRPSAYTNILGSLNVFEAANQYDLPVVYAGVGNHWMRDHGTGSYTISKTAAEDYVRMFNSYRDGNVSIVRPVNAYGPNQIPAAPYGPSKVRKIMPSFICRGLLGEPIEIYGDGSQISDCIYVADVARVFVTALEQGSEKGPISEHPVEVGPRDSSTVAEIARLVADETARIAGHEPSELVYLPMRPGEVPAAVVKADVSTLEQLGMNATDFLPLDLGIQKTVAHYAEEWLTQYR